MNEKQNTGWGVCVSLMLHGLAAAVLLVNLSGNAMMPRDAGRLDFVWVTLAAGDKMSSVPAEVAAGQKARQAATRIIAMPERPAVPIIRVEPEKSAEGFAAPVDHKTMTLSGANTVPPAAAGGYFQAPNAGRQTVSSGAAPASSSAYPRYRENPSPGYPEMARQQGYEGVVLVSAEILADGRVGRVVISKSSGYAILDQTAVKAVMAWKFEPAKKSGVPYKTWAELPIKFMISDHHSQS